jgi:uncharacterized protein (TIGR02996 family)
MPRRSPPESAEAPRPEVLAFLQDIKENPEDDTPRLVLADWLEERGDARGEFVRLQCRRARLSEDDPAVRALEGREAELLKQHRAAWLGVLAEKAFSTEFRRGLVKVTATARNLLSKRLAALPPAEALAWVDSLHVYDMNADAVVRLAESPHWTHLSSLDLSGNMYYADHLAGQFTVGMNVPGGLALVELPLLGRLTRLDLSCNDIGAEGMAALAARRDLGRLRVLDLSMNNFHDEGAAALASCRSLKGLTTLNLSRNRIGPAGAAALARWRGLSTVITLSLFGNPLGAEGVAALAASPLLRRLTELRLGVETIGHPNVRASQIGPKGAAALAGSPHLKRLTSLYLSGNAIGPKGAAALAASRTLTRLTSLDLSDNAIGDAGARALASSPLLRGLTSLSLRYNGIGDKGALALAASPHLARVRDFNFRANHGVSRSALEALRQRFGDGFNNEHFDP